MAVVAALSWGAHHENLWAHQSRHVSKRHHRIHHLGFFRHHRECRTFRCARHGDRLYVAHMARKRARELARRPVSSLEACIIRTESGGNPDAVNGQYTGIAQWSPTAWAVQGGTRYSSTPLGASYAEQETILREALAAGRSGEWTPYDPC